MTDRRRARWGLVLLAVGAVLLAVRAVVHTPGAFLVALAVTAVVIGVVLLLMGRGTTSRHVAVAAEASPEAMVLEVWGAAGLFDALTREGVADAPVRRRQGTALTLVVEAGGLTLWGGAGRPHRVHSLAWPDVLAIGEGSGIVANDGPRPALVVRTVRGADLVLLPARVATGSLRTGDVHAVRTLGSQLAARRAAA